MTAARLWARADLRTRWRSWVVLGLLAGATFGLAAAGVAGARRTSNALPRYVSAARVPNAAVLANDPSFDAAQRAAVAKLPEVRATYPFLVAIALEVTPPGFNATLIPTEAQAVQPMIGVIIAGRMPDPAKADEVVVDQNARRQFGLDLGETMAVGQSITQEEAAAAPPGLAPQGLDLNFHTQLRVVGIAKSVTSDASWTPSFGFYAKYGGRMAGFTNQFVDLRRGDADLPSFRVGVERIVGHSVNIESSADLAGLRKAANIMELERNGLLLFALAVILGGGVLVGQALVRAVTAGAGDLPTWRAIGADRRTVVPALALPAVVSAIAAAASAIVAAVALSSRFPIGLARRYDLDPDIHADWPVLGLAAGAVAASVIAIAWLSGWWRTTRAESVSRRPSAAAGWAARAGLSPTLLIGSRLAVEPGRGRRAVPVRSALVGAIAGVVGLVACFTFRAGINDAITSPQRSGIVWDFTLQSGIGPVRPADLATIAHDRDVASALEAQWSRAVPINGTTTPTFGTATVKGDLQLVVLNGRAPRGPDEIAFAPATMRELKVHIGDHVIVGTSKKITADVVGSALLPATSHTDYDQSAWMTNAGLHAALATAGERGFDDLQDYVLMRWKPHTHVAQAEARIRKLGAVNEEYDSEPTSLPPAVVDLGRLRSLPLSLGAFFALMACATVAHALVTTVRRRKHDLAVLRTIGFTPRQCRAAIAVQASLLAAVGFAVGLPLGIATGRLVWRWLADSFPVVYVPPLALVAALLVAPAAIAIANILAAGPAHVATRLRPADALHTE